MRFGTTSAPRTPWGVGVRLHSMGLSLREVVAVFEWLDVDRSHGAVWNWTHTLAEKQADPPTAKPSRVAVDETQITVDGEKSGSTPLSTLTRSCCSISTYSADAGSVPRRSRELRSRAAHQNAKRSEDGVPSSTHHQPRRLRYRVSRRRWWVSDRSRLA